jgi:hypothetical protein
MSFYTVRLAGCDGTNEVVVELDDTEVVVVRTLAEVLNANSEYTCEPKMHIEEYPV